MAASHLKTYLQWGGLYTNDETVFKTRKHVSKSFLLITWYATFKKLQEKTVKVLTPEFKALNIFLFVQKQ